LLLRVIDLTDEDVVEITNTMDNLPRGVSNRKEESRYLMMAFSQLHDPILKVSYMYLSGGYFIVGRDSEGLCL